MYIPALTALSPATISFVATDRRVSSRPATANAALGIVRELAPGSDVHSTYSVDVFPCVLCAELARQIDPMGLGKTLIFCATDDHANIVVRLLRLAFAAQYGEVDEDAVVKITGAADTPQK
jgi:hypothetical protein